MNIDPGKLAAAIITLGTVAAILGGWARWALPRYRKARSTVGAVVETLIGREAYVDKSTGKELVPARPGIGVRLDAMEQAVVRLAEQNERLEDHETRILRLEEASVERVVARQESAQAWRAIGNLAEQGKGDDE